MGTENLDKPGNSLVERILIGFIGVLLISLLVLLAWAGKIKIPVLATLFGSQEPRIIATHGHQDIYIMNSDGSNSRVLFSNPGMGIHDLSWSPDGNYIFFSGEVDDNEDIYRINSKGKDLVRLTTHPEHDVEPVLSHDGTRIAFVSRRSGFDELFVMNFDGSSIKRIAVSNARSPSWGPNDEWILYSRNQFFTDHLVMVKPDGTEEYAITPEGVYQAPSWSPDGQFIAYFQDYNLMMTTVDGSSVWFLTDRIAYRKPSWSPDSSQIAFLTYNSQIAIIEVSTRNVTQITGEAGKASNWSQFAWEPAVE